MSHIPVRLQGKRTGFRFCETRRKTKPCPAHFHRRSLRPYFVLQQRPGFPGARDRALGRRPGRAGRSQPPRHLPGHAPVLSPPAADGCGTKPVPKAWQSGTGCGVQSPGEPGRKVAAEEQSQGPGAGTGSGGDSAVGSFVCEKGTLCVKTKK